MPTYSEREATLWVETRREGVLSTIGHDLRFELGRFQVDVHLDPARGSGTFELSTLSLRGALEGDVERPDAIGHRDRLKIERQVARDVLAVSRYPTARFDTTACDETPDGYQLRGLLTLRGIERPIVSEVIRLDDQLEARVALRTSDFGIKPVTALFGALKVRDTVNVILSIPFGDRA